MHDNGTTSPRTCAVPAFSSPRTLPDRMSRMLVPLAFWKPSGIDLEPCDQLGPILRDPPIGRE